MTKPTNAIQTKFATTRKELADSLIERDSEIDLTMTALIAKQHALLVGPPGVGKSLLLDSLMNWMHGRKFSILFTKFTVPEEVFGPISIVGLKADKYRRITTGRLPEADAAFGDEIWKASSAIANTLLKALNERVYDNGEGPRPIPLRIFVAASNEYPHAQEGGKELGALFDRFLFRKNVRPIMTAAGRQRLLWGTDHTPKLSTSITPGELDQASADASRLPWSDEAKEALEQIIRELAKDGILPGDRRQYQSVGAAKAAAYLAGADKVEPDHLEVLAHVLWDDPTEQPEKAAQIVARVANPVGMAVNSLLLETEQILASSDVSQLSQAASATVKLGEIAKKLSGLTSANGRAEKAIAYVKGEIKRIKVQSVESF